MRRGLGQAGGVGQHRLWPGGLLVRNILEQCTVRSFLVDSIASQQLARQLHQGLCEALPLPASAVMGPARRLRAALPGG